jgi:serine/threonine protein kinase
MSPETMFKNEYTTKSDIWSLGILFYEMIKKDVFHLIQIVRQN